MKAMVCEMCNGNDLIKQDGVYVCQSCGTKYSVEDAKKLMIDGTVNVQGTVQIDKSVELDNLYQLARRAKSNNDAERAINLYEQILVYDPSSWEAEFYTLYFRTMVSAKNNICKAAKDFYNRERSIIEFIKTNDTDSQNQKNALREIATKTAKLSHDFFENSLRRYKKERENKDSILLNIILSDCCAAIDMVYRLGDVILNVFGTEYAKSISTKCWIAGVDEHARILPYFKNKKSNTDTINLYVNKIKTHQPDYQPPELKTSGCYVATAVYGSYDCPQVWTLRRYRDNKLAKTWHGRTFIKTYYAISPTLVKWFGNTQWFKKMWIGRLDKMVNKLQTEGFESTPYEDTNW